MALNLWGFDPNGKPRAYAIGVSADRIADLRAKAKDEGWTNLITNTYSSSEPSTESSDHGPATPASPSPRARSASST